MALTRIYLEAPYLLFMGDVGDDGHAKTGHGIAYWRASRCAGQMRLPGCAIDTGLPELGVDETVDAGVRTAIIGVAPTGGGLPDHWIAPLVELARAGIDIASGLHTKLADIPDLVGAAQQGGGRLVDVRVPPKNLPVGRGRRRSGKRVLTVGTDCAVGKKYSALALHLELIDRGVNATFRATGQTGIMIAGAGIPIDSVVADFISGAAEVLSPDNDPAHWDIIEGQGSLLHPSYAGVTLGLLHGSQADAIVLCHVAGRTELLGLEGHFPLPPFNKVIELVLECARVTNPDCMCAGISVNTAAFTGPEREAYLESLAEAYAVPAVDPVATGMAPVADYLLERVP